MDFSSNFRKPIEMKEVIHYSCKWSTWNAADSTFSLSWTFQHGYLANAQHFYWILDKGKQDRACSWPLQPISFEWMAVEESLNTNSLLHPSLGFLEFLVLICRLKNYWSTGSLCLLYPSIHVYLTPHKGSDICTHPLSFNLDVCLVFSKHSRIPLN